MDTFLYLGLNENSYSGQQPVRFLLDDRRRHVLISGRSGTGKSTLLANMFAQEANSGRGALLIDPHGDLAEDALDLVPPRRIRKTLYLNPADTEWPIGFNVLDNIPPSHRARHTADLVAAFRAVWESSWGPRLEHILYNTIAALLEMPGATLLGVQRMLLSPIYRARVLQHVTDPLIVQFWRDEFPTYEKKFGPEATAPVLNKIGQLFSSPLVRNILGNPKTAFDARHLIDNNYLVIANLSKGQLGQQHTNLLGSLLIATFGSAALSRADVHPDKRPDFVMIIDEFPNYTTTALASLLSEARKYRLSLVLAHQYLHQMALDVKAAVLGNVGSVVVFCAGPEDADTFGQVLKLPPEMTTSTENFKALCRISIGGTLVDNIVLMTPPPPAKHGHGLKIVGHSRIHYATEAAKITERINRFLAPDKPPRRPSLKDTRRPPTW